MSFVFFALGAIVFLLLVSGGYVFCIACVRTKETNWLVEEEVQKTSYAPFYQSMVEADKWLRDHNAKSVYIESHDGLQLHGRWIPAEDAKGTIILFHGYRSTVIADFGPAFELYHRKGLNILVPDQRSHGKSQGRFITFGVKESKDALRWVKYHNETYGEIPLFLSGLSMGASTVMYVADQDLPDNVRGIIADCGFTSPAAILSSVYTNVTHLPAGVSIFVTDLFARLFAGFSLYQKDSCKTLSQNKTPILIVHGTDDGFVPCRMSRQSYAACKGPKELLLVKGADHGVSFLTDTKLYKATIDRFMDKCMEDSK